MLNKAILMGFSTCDPELRHTQSNMAVCSFSLLRSTVVARIRTANARLTSSTSHGAQGRVRCTVVHEGFYGTVVEVSIQSRRWQDQNGNNRTAIEVNCDEVPSVKRRNPAMPTMVAIRAVLAAMTTDRRCGPSLPRPRLLRLSISLQEIRIFGAC